VSSTNLVRSLVINGGSPAHFYAYWSGNPQRVEEPEREAFVLGRAVHHLHLGQAKFLDEFSIRPEELNGKSWQGNRLDCRAWIQAQEDAGKTVLTNKQIETLRGMAISLGNNYFVREAKILEGLVERSIIMRDKETGLWLKSRPDVIPTDSGQFSDLKTTVSVHYPDLVRTVTQYAYAQQAALCRTVAREVLQIEMQSWALVFIEKTPPYCVRVSQLKPQDIDLGEKLNRMALRAVARGLETGEWPGPAEIDGNDGAYIDQTDLYRTKAQQAWDAAEGARQQA
jgi:hypothetical protein